MKALGAACRVLIHASSYGCLIASSAKLHRDVLEIAPFTLIIPGPCELILFRAVVTIPGTCEAIQRDLDEPLRCLPLPVFKTWAYYVTDQAMELYRRMCHEAQQLEHRSSTSDNDNNYSNNNDVTRKMAAAKKEPHYPEAAMELPVMLNLMPTQARPYDRRNALTISIHHRPQPPVPNYVFSPSFAYHQLLVCIYIHSIPLPQHV